MCWHQLNFDRGVGSNFFLKIPVLGGLMYVLCSGQASASFDKS